MENHITTELTYLEQIAKLRLERKRELMEQSMKHEIHQHLCPDCKREWACDREPCTHGQEWECVLDFFANNPPEVTTPDKLKRIYG